MPPRQPPAPATDDELILARGHHEEILLRLPPDDPGCLFRASLVCKAWRILLTSPVFARRYRQFHRTPPLLGFFENHHSIRVWFEPSSPTPPFLPMLPDHRELFAFDCRHGLVLMRTPVLDSADETAKRIIVWDPIGHRQWEFPPPEFAADILYDNAAVLCAADGCDHLDCHGDRFLVAYVGCDYAVAHASVFSSETRAWSAVATCHDPQTKLEMCGYQFKAHVGNVLYFNCVVGTIILRFDYIRMKLSIIHGPGIGMPQPLPMPGIAIPEPPSHVLMETKEGVLGCATLQKSRLCLWSMEAVPDGSVAWKQGRVIEHEMLLSCKSDPANVVGFADGIDVFYLSTAHCILTVDLKSVRVKNTQFIRGHSAIPYTSFYTPDQTRAITLLDGWEEVGNGENEGEQQEEKAAQDLFSEGSKAFEDGDFVRAVDCLRRSLEIREVHHGKLSPKCRDTYYRYGWALLRGAQACRASNKYSTAPTEQYYFDLDLAWKMLHVARAIFQKSPGSTREKVKIFAALARVSMQREDIEYSFTACFKALAILKNLVGSYHHRIINLNKQRCYTSEFPKSGDTKAISLCKSRIQNLKWTNKALLADKGADASATEVGLEESSLARDIQFVTDILLRALEKKLEGLDQAISTPVSEASDVSSSVSLTSSQYSGSSNTMSTAETTEAAGSTGTDLEAAGRGIKRANVEQSYDEPSPKKFAEDSPSEESDGSNSTDG